MPSVVPVQVYSPQASSVTLVTFSNDGSTENGRIELRRDGDYWRGEVGAGTVYGLVAQGDDDRVDASKVLLDPYATEVAFPPGFDRGLATKRGKPNSGQGPLAVARPPRSPRPPRLTSRGLVVYEAHVRGMTRLVGGDDAGTYRAMIGQLDRLAGLGFTVLELLPVHQNDPQEGSYWGYMPLAFGAVHRQYAAGEDAAEELAALVSAAHEHDIEVWLDVVFNHTTEVDANGPTYHLRGLADGEYYCLDEQRRYIETSGCGNDINTAAPAAQDLIVWSLDRLADLGVDGFRFDLAPVLSRHRPFIALLDEWAGRRGVRMIAEPWDAVGTHELGRAWPGAGWMQWSDRFREDVRGLLRAERGLVPAVTQRVQGSPDVFDSPLHSVNFLSCHDGFTLYDVMAYDHKHNEANGHHNTDGAGDNRSWNCGWEGDDGAPDDVLALRQRQLRNAWSILAMSHGVPMVAMGDEFGRTQRGNNNAYNQDNETSWVDWVRRDRFTDLERFVGRVLALRHRHPVLSQPHWWDDAVRFFGASGEADTAEHSCSLAWTVGDLYVIVNAYWEPLEFAIQTDGPWARVVDTSRPSPDDVVEPDMAPIVGGRYDVTARSVVILERRPAESA
jgi:glycogen operon protein